MARSIFNQKLVKRVIVGVDKRGATFAANEIDNSTPIAGNRRKDGLEQCKLLGLVNMGQFRGNR